jgi:hypothetical protein
MMSDIITSMKRNITDRDTRKSVYHDLIEIFRAEDCDTLMECINEDDMFKEAMKYCCPQYFSK